LLSRASEKQLLASLSSSLRYPPFIFLQGAQAVAVDSLLSERASLSHSAGLIDEYTSLASNVLSSIKSQRGTLKSAHKKALDVATSLGLSSTLMRMIERRTTSDKILVYGGMIFLLLLTVIMWWFLVAKK
jgi:golgi SNAP receptor complex member 2